MLEISTSQTGESERFFPFQKKKKKKKEKGKKQKIFQSPRRSPRGTSTCQTQFAPVRIRHVSLKDLKKTQGANQSYREIGLDLPKSFEILRLVVNKTGKLLLLVSLNHVAVVELEEIGRKKGLLGMKKIDCRYFFFLFFFLFLFFFIFYFFFYFRKLSQRVFPFAGGFLWRQIFCKAMRRKL